MANGFAEALLVHLDALYADPTKAPSRKITPPGYLKMLLQSARPNIISDGREVNGHIRDVRVKYQTRGTEAIVSDEDNCDIDIIPVYEEVLVNNMLFRKIGLFIPDETIRKYEEDASRMVSSGGFPTQLMKETLDSIIKKAAGLVNSINAALLAEQVTNFGVHVETGTAAAVAINLPLDRTQNDLSEGMSGLISRIINNELDPNDVSMVGNGLMLNYMQQQAAKSYDQAGVNTALEFLPRFFWDPRTATVWGANQFGIFERDAVQLIEMDQFVGGFQGKKGTSDFFNAPLPLVDSLGESLQSMNFDMQLRYLDCPTEIVVDYTTQTVQRGYLLTVSKTFQQFNVPDNAYEDDDRLTGSNGTLRFVATNT